MARKEEYVITDEADVHTLVAGKRREKDTPFKLTAAEAEYELKRGLIQLAKAAEPDGPEETAGETEAAIEEAALAPIPKLDQSARKFRG